MEQEQQGSENTDSQVSRLLIVEDDSVSREFLVGLLTRWGFAAIDAEGADHAQRILAARGLNHFDCVLTDYRMPERSGLDLLAWIRERDSTLATVLLTGEGPGSVMQNSFRGGAVDFLDKPVEPLELRAAIDKAVTQTRQARHMARMASAVEQLGQAQRWMLHSSPVGDQAVVDLYFHPKLEAGGDFFTHLQLSPTCYFFLLTDVSGHDLQAAYISAYFQGIVRGMLEHGASIGKIFQFFNHFLLEEWKKDEAFRPAAARRDISLSASAISLDLARRTATTLTSGAPAPVYLTPGGFARRLGPSGGPPLGWFQDTAISALTYGLADGGTILMWTDGLEDLAHDRGVDPLALAYCWRRSKITGAAFPMLQTSNDDVLLARIGLQGNVPDSGFHPLVLAEYEFSQAGELDLWMDRWRRSVRLAVPEITAAAEHDFALATREAVLNALEHGCRNFPQDPATLQIGYRWNDALLRVWVQDPGPGHDHFQSGVAASLDADEEHFGLQLIRSLPQAVKFEQQGAAVTMDFNVT